MKNDYDSLNDAQKEVILELNNAMGNLFEVFVKVDSVDLPITDALEMVGIEIPLLLKPAVNQLSGKLKQIKKEANKEELIS